MIGKSGKDKTRYVHGSRAYQAQKVSLGRFQFFFAEFFSPAVHMIVMFSACGSLLLLLDADGFGFS